MPRWLAARLREWQIQPRRGLGQHFLIEGGVLKRIVRAARLTAEDVVVEVGPGLGILTRALARRTAKVIAVEVDPRLCQWLRADLAQFPNLEIVEGDILALPPSALLPPGLSSYKVVANLPYNIATAVLRHFLSGELRPQTMVVMLQREVAESIVAAPGKMSLLSVMTQFYSRPSLVSLVAASSFYPRPKVESAILRLEVYPWPPLEVEPTRFFKLVAAGFAAPRKQFHNSLALGLGLTPGEVRERLNRAEIDSSRRAQTLSLEEWAKVWQAFSGLGVMGN